MRNMIPEQSERLPRVNLATFNYGTCSPWYRFGPNAQYRRASIILDALRVLSEEQSSRVWALEMALREIRLAETMSDRVRATLALRDLLAARP